jgi:GTPase SAR1 family protein
LIHSKGLVFIGPAGVGKTTLWQAFARYLEKTKGFTVRRVNMDPGSHSSREIADFDITTSISSQDLMEQQKLGPNGAILEACRQIYAQREQIFKNIIPGTEEAVDFILIDTPGQLDSFVLQPFGATFFNELNNILPLSAVYLFDATALQSPVNIPAQLFLNAAATFQLNFEVTPCLSKADLVDVTKVLPLLQEPQSLSAIIGASTRGVLSDLAMQSLETLSRFRLPVRIIPVSGLQGVQSGLDELYALLEEQDCACGDRL